MRIVAIASVVIGLVTANHLADRNLYAQSKGYDLARVNEKSSVSFSTDRTPSRIQENADARIVIGLPRIEGNARETIKLVPNVSTPNTLSGIPTDARHQSFSGNDSRVRGTLSSWQAGGSPSPSDLPLIAEPPSNGPEVLPPGEAIAPREQSIPPNWETSPEYLGVEITGENVHCLPEDNRFDLRSVPLEPVFDKVFAEVEHGRRGGWGKWGSILGIYRDPFAEPGLGTERAGVAPFELDVTQPFNQCRLRFDAAYDVEFPDRSEYFWAKTAGGRGPLLPEESVDYQDVRFLMEVGGDKFSTATDIGIRSVDPINNPNHTGLADMSIAPKTVIIDGDQWQISTIFRTYINTGSPSMGLGTGHVSLEPGVLFRHRYNDWNYFHGELKYWFPLGSDPIHSGQVLRWGLGWSRVGWETDDFSVIPTFELVHWTALNGQKTNPNGFPLPVDGDSILVFFPGLRMSYDSGGDLGLCEFGISGGIATTGQRWYSGLLRFDVRWVY